MTTNETTDERGIDPEGVVPDDATLQVAYDAKAYFESFYQSTVDGTAVDRDTIGGAVTEPESRFHYNATENAIIRGMLTIDPLPPAMLIRARHALRERAQLSLIDIGSGTGHWIDFFRSTYQVATVTAIEITRKMSEFLEHKYSGQPVRIVSGDVSDAAFTEATFTEPVDYITAIGVMFHIVDDDQWRRSITNLAAALKQDGIIVFGGEFGDETLNVQFHHVDEFSTWRESREGGNPSEVRVNKRIRSLDMWQSALESIGLEVVDVVRTDDDARLATPENNVLIAVRSDGKHAGKRP